MPSTDTSTNDPQGGYDRSTHVSGLPPEIWTLVGEEIQSDVAFKALRLTCRTFRDIFTPVAFDIYHLELKSISQLENLELRQTLCHTKTLCIQVDSVSIDDTFAEEIDKAAEPLVHILQQMPKLQLLQWTDSSFELHDCILLLRNPDLLDCLKSRKSLRNVAIQFCAANCTETVDGLENCSTTLQGFKNLTSLELYNFYGDCKAILKDIANTLAECPCLKKLGLGRATKTTYGDQNGIGSDELLILDDVDLLESLCLLYGAQVGTLPLKVHTLRLGYSMFFTEPSSSTVGNYLTKLLDLRTLKSLEMYNGYVLLDAADVSDPDRFKVMLQPPWELLDDCSLRQLGVTKIDHRVTAYLTGAGQSVEELSVSGAYCMNDPAIQEFNLFSLPNLKSLWTREKFVSRNPNRDNSIDFDSPYETLPQETTVGELEDQDEEEELLWGGRLEKKEQKFILHRLHDRGSRLATLAINFDFDSEYIHFIALLPKLTCLTQLSLQKKREGYWYQQFPAPNTSMWPSIQTQEDIAHRYAQMMAMLCTSLQHIQIGLFSWQVMTPSHLRPPVPTPIHGDIDGELKLRRLDHREIHSIEFFCRHPDLIQSGLPTTVMPEYFEELQVKDGSESNDGLVVYDYA
ncbi:hypothetical protein ONS95_000101 [Cadophora gregata]|uniref:uncharacterized protein n=1 Tax=Cadophora gregata TaxID=51156 RepID=UPI0026DD789F|nr:uncharacterized protein ONS95_000101 [Cadophora gregata]KAK0115629.1 hypothetical protein ONS96_014076 [Cadophora gregata f. sp. sojae]KAK0128118.1 hypothetical protein ONS95_000101 [Cadophora gregata]